MILTSNDKPIVAVISLMNVDEESLSLSMNPEFMRIIEQSRREFRLGKKLSLDEMKREAAAMN